MSTKQTMTLALSDAEMRVLDEMAAKKGLSKTGVLRQALRFYQLVDVRNDQGYRLVFKDAANNELTEMVLL